MSNYQVGGHEKSCPGAAAKAPAPDCRTSVQHGAGAGPDLSISHGLGPAPGVGPQASSTLIFKAAVAPGYWMASADAMHVTLRCETCPACDAPTWHALRRGRLRVYLCGCGAAFQGRDVEARVERFTHGLSGVPTVSVVPATGAVLAWAGIPSVL